MADLDQFLPQAELLGEISEISQETREFSEPVTDNAKSPEPVVSEFDDADNEEIVKICREDNNSLSENVKTDSGYTSSISENDKLSPSIPKSGNSPENPTTESISLSPSRTPTKASPKSNRAKSASPGNKRAVFSPENHRKHMSAFKLREIEKKKALEDRRKKQDMELEQKRIAIMKKHQEADKRLQEKMKASPRKSGTFGSSVAVRSRSSMNLNLADREKTGSVQNLSKVQLRPQSATPRLRRPVSMGSLPTTERVTLRNSSSATLNRRSQTPGAITKGVINQPVIKQKRTEETDKKSKIKNKVELKNLLRPAKVFPAKKKAEPIKTTPAKTSRDAQQRRTVANQPNSAPTKPTKRKSSFSKPSHTAPEPTESPSKSVMNISAQEKVNQQEEAKARLEEARKKAREERARQEEEQRRFEEERRVEAEKQRLEAEEARARMLKEKELRKKQAEEEAERQKREAQEKDEEERAAKQKEDQVRIDQLQAEQEERRQKEEDRMAKEEEERRERQKKLDAILKRSSLKMDAPKREISANASAILAKHNIAIPKPCATVLSEGAGKLEDRENDENNEGDGSAEDRKVLEEIEIATAEDSAIGYVDNPKEDLNDNESVEFHSDLKETEGSDANKLIELSEGQFEVENHKTVSDLLDIRNDNTDAAKDANEFTIGITSSEESHISSVL